MIGRALAGKLAAMAGSFPVVTLTGPRQSGKSTLVKETFPEYRYVSLEDPDIRAFAQEDPRLFLERYDEEVVIDEAQHVPELFSYMQGAVDARDTPGRYILSGSQNFLLMKSISQSLAGRAAVLHLLPLSYSELLEADLAPAALDDCLLAGGYPRIYAHGLAPADFFPSYIATYLERDVRAELGVRKVSEFSTFLSLCATRVGQLLSLDGLARDCGVNVDTVRGWLSLLQQSFVVFLRTFTTRGLRQACSGSSRRSSSSSPGNAAPSARTASSPSWSRPITRKVARQGFSTGATARETKSTSWWRRPAGRRGSSR